MNEEYLRRTIKKRLGDYFLYYTNRFHFEHNPSEKEFLQKQVTTVAKFIADSGLEIQGQDFVNGKYWITLCHKENKKDYKHHDGYAFFDYGKCVHIEVYGKGSKAHPLYIIIDEEGIHGNLGIYGNEVFTFKNQFLHDKKADTRDCLYYGSYRDTNKNHIAGLDAYVKKNYPEVFKPKLKLTPNKKPVKK